MSLFSLFLSLLPIIAISFLLIAIASDQRKKQKELLRKHGHFLGNTKKYRVLWLPSNRLSLLTINKEIQKKFVYLACAQNQLRVVIGGAPRQDDVELALSPEQCQIRKIRLGAFASRFATLIELTLPSSRAFLIAIKGMSLSPKETRNLFNDLSTYFQQKQELTLKYKWETPLLTLVGVLLVASACYAFYHITDIAPTGPIGIAQASPDKLLAFNSSTILLFNEQGDLMSKYHNPHLDYRAVAFADHDRYYIMDRKSKKLLTCHENECSPSYILANPPLATSLGLTVSTDGQYLITIEPNEDRIRVFTRDGQQRQMLAKPDHRFCFPNSGVFGRDGRFYMTDANLNRVIAFDFIDGKLYEKEEYLMVKSRPDSSGKECTGGKINRFIKRSVPEGKAKALPNVRKGRVWPMDIAQLNDGRWAVLLARNGMRDADIVLFNEDWTKPEPLAMPENSDITAITSWKGRLAATDLANPGLWSINNKQFSPWHDDSFQEWMRLIEEQKIYYRKQKLLVSSAILLVVMLLAGAFLLINQMKFKWLSRHTKNQ